MAHQFPLSRVPAYRKSPTPFPPENRALLIGINYTSPVGDNERGYRKLMGPVNDAKDMKKTLIEFFHYEEQDICLMTDAKKDTALWPSKANIMHALCDLIRGARPRDSFVFFYTGHSGQQPATTNSKTDGLDKYIVTCDYEIILDDTLRKYLVDPLPAGTRLTAILDACHSGTLLKLDHYFCHCFLPLRSQCLPVSVSPSISERKQVGVGVSTSIPRQPCRISSCANSSSKAPLVISVSSCSDHHATWEDSQSKGKSMTTKLVKILRETPSINVGDLNHRLQNDLTKRAFKRVLNAKRAFKMFSAKLSPELRKKWEDEYFEKGLFGLRTQTAQFGSLHSLCQEEGFIVKRTHTLDLQLNALLHPF
ncbi:caspase domain-containing protein [Lactarius pseudohatsudake]|nr:caspase domain-containing protein [Lactarius pseudohatsudake]